MAIGGSGRHGGRLRQHDRYVGLKGKRFEFNPPERRCLELQLAPAERLRQEAARVEVRALLEARAFLVERLGLPADGRVKIVREDGHPVAIEVVEPQAPAPAVTMDPTKS